jgi:hypothetical protein
MADPVLARHVSALQEATLARLLERGGFAFDSAAIRAALENRSPKEAMKLLLERAREIRAAPTSPQPVPPSGNTTSPPAVSPAVEPAVSPSVHPAQRGLLHQIAETAKSLWLKLRRRI